MLVNTHGHPDHIYGNVYFDNAYIHPADYSLAKSFLESEEYISYCKENNLTVPAFSEIHEGDVIDLGGRHLEIYELPGHTKGGIVLLLKEDRILFTGDSINHHLWMQLEGCSPLDEYVRNLDRIMFLENEADTILHGHARDFDDISLMRCLRDGVEELYNGNTDKDKPYHYFAGDAMQHPFKCRSDRKYQQKAHVICYQESMIKK